MTSPFIELTRKKMAAVVQIYADGWAGEDVKSILNPRLGDLKEWSGSGFFLQSEYGEDLIITNAHVAKNAKSLEIMSMLTSEETFQVELVGIVKNQEPDIAILRLKEGEVKRFKDLAKQNIPALSLRKNNIIMRGTELKAIGYPMGMTEPNITGGEITNFVSGDRFAAEKYVTDAAINPGNSGGPAIDEDGNVIGVNTSIFQDAENIGFITPFTYIEIILKNIFENNAICFSDIGANFQKNSKDVSRQLGMFENRGIIVSSIEKNGFMDKAGIKEEDVILSLNDIPIDRHGILISGEHYHRRNLFDLFKLIPIGNDVHLKIWREKQELSITAQTRPHAKTKIESRPFINERVFLDIWGMTIQVLSYEILEAFNIVDTQQFYLLLKNFDEYQERLIVTHIEKESEAYFQEWSIGEVIKEVNGVTLKSMDHLIELLSVSNPYYKLKTEFGSIGYFEAPKRKKEIKLKNPSMFLK